MVKKIVLTSVVVSCIALGGWLGLSGGLITQSVPTQYPGLGGDFTLQSAQGEAVSLSDYQGQIVLIYFGYTHCPDVCIAALGKIARAIESLPKNLQTQIQPLFISLDPERDTAEKLTAYGQNFHPKIRSLTGTTEQVNAIAKRYFIANQKIPEGTAGAYRMDHSSVTYVIGRTGEVLKLIHQTDTTEEMANALFEVLR
jgi:protein SCO1/2